MVQSVFALSMLCLSIDWAAANLKQQTFNFIIRIRNQNFKQQQVKHIKLPHGACTQFLPCLQAKGGMCRHKKDGGEGCIEEKGSSSPCSQIPSTPCIVCNFFLWCGLRWEVRGGIPSPGTVQQRALPCDPVASADASSGSRPRSREGVNPQK